MNANTAIAARAQNGSRTGFVLAGVLVLVLLASMLVMSLLFQMHGSEASIAATRAADQAWLACMSGVEEALRVASTSTPGSLDWRESPNSFKERFIFEDGSDRWFFTVYGKADDDAFEPIRYGLTDESSKLDLNVVPREVLARLPGLEKELLDAMDGKITIAAEADPDPLAFLDISLPLISRGYLTLAELLSVKGFNPRLVYGEDANFNLRLDPNEDDSESSSPPDNADGRLDFGLSAYLTVNTYEPNVDNNRVRRTDINDPIDPFPLVQLPESLTNYISALRTNRIKVNHAAELLEASVKVKDAKGVEVQHSSGVTKEELPQVLDLFSGAPGNKKQEGLVNVNTAPIKILAALPGLDETLAESISSARKSISAERRATLAWLVQEGTLTTEQFKRVAPSLTARSFQYSFHVVGYGLPSGKYRVLEAIIDVSDKPVVTSLRDLTRYGLPVPLTEPVTESMAQAGKRRRTPESVRPPSRHVQNLSRRSHA